MRRFDQCYCRIQSLYQQLQELCGTLPHPQQDQPVLWKIEGALRTSLLEDPVLRKKYTVVIGYLHAGRFHEVTRLLNTAGKDYFPILRDVIFQEAVTLRDQRRNHPYFKYPGVMEELLCFMRLFSAENEARLDYQIFTAELALMLGYREEAERRLKPAFKKVPDSLFLKNILKSLQDYES